MGDVLLQPVDVNTNAIPDPWEIAFFNSLVSAAADDDLDGHNNAEEYLAGTNPTNAASLFQIVNPVINGLTVTWTVEPARTYTVLSTTNLAASSWTTIFGPASPCCGQPDLNWTDTNSVSRPTKQYRVNVQRN